MSNASPTIFGFQYQIDAAICFFVRSIKDFSEIRVEGRLEDIEIECVSGSKYFLQVKSIVNIDNYRSDDNFKKALISLSSLKLRKNDKIGYCSNQRDNFILKSKEFTHNSIIEYEYNDLTSNTKNRIDNLISKNMLSIETNKLLLIKIPYNQSVNLNTKRAFIIEEVQKLLSRCKCDIYLAEDLVQKWHDDFEHMATSRSPMFSRTKEDFIFVILATYLDEKSSDIQPQDESLVEEINDIYKKLIKENTIDFKVSNIIYSLYEEYKKNTTKQTINEFILIYFEDISKIIFGKKNSLAEVEVEALRLIVKNILHLRIKVKEIKREVNL